VVTFRHWRARERQQLWISIARAAILQAQSVATAPNPRVGNCSQHEVCVAAGNSVEQHVSHHQRVEKAAATWHQVEAAPVHDRYEPRGEASASAQEGDARNPTQKQYALRSAHHKERMA